MLAAQLAQASSARPGEPGCFLQKQPPSGGTFWRAQMGLGAICTPIFTKYTPSFSISLSFLPPSYNTLILFSFSLSPCPSALLSCVPFSSSVFILLLHKKYFFFVQELNTNVIILCIDTQWNYISILYFFLTHNIIMFVLCSLMRCKHISIVLYIKNIRYIITSIKYEMVNTKQNVSFFYIKNYIQHHLFQKSM